MLLFVTVCFILLYRQVIVSFFASVKTGVSIQLVAIANLNVTPVTLLDFSAIAQNEIGFPIRVGRFVFYVKLLYCCLFPLISEKKGPTQT